MVPRLHLYHTVTAASRATYLTLFWVTAVLSGTPWICCVWNCHMSYDSNIFNLYNLNDNISIFIAHKIAFQSSAETPSDVHWRRFYFQLTCVHGTLEHFVWCTLQIYLLTYLTGKQHTQMRFSAAVTLTLTQWPWYELDLNIMKMYLHTKIELSMPRHSNVKELQIDGKQTAAVYYCATLSMLYTLLNKKFSE